MSVFQGFGSARLTTGVSVFQGVGLERFHCACNDN